MATAKEWMGVKEAAEALGMGRTAVYALVASGKLSCYRLGGPRARIRFKQADLDAFAEASRVGPKVRAAPRAGFPRAKYDHGL